MRIHRNRLLRYGLCFHGRRFVGLSALMLLVLFTLLARNESPRRLSPPLQDLQAWRVAGPLPVPNADLSWDLAIPDLQMSRGLPLRPPPPEVRPPVPPAALPAVAAAPPPLPVTPPAPSTPVAPEPSLPAEDASEVVAQAEGESGLSVSDSERRAPSASWDPIEMTLRLRLLVHPRVPERVINKCKIDASVLLQLLVGSDGHVHEVRVLRGIPGCDECTQSAIEAAELFVYDAPPVGPDAGLVSTTPVEIHFSYGRAKG